MAADEKAHKWNVFCCGMAYAIPSGHSSYGTVFSRANYAAQIVLKS
jgi:hypothetical protein